jgi:hypothetical protein
MSPRRRPIPRLKTVVSNQKIEATMEEVGIRGHGDVGIVDVDVLNVDHSYQRPANQLQVNRIAAHFDLDKAQVIDVSIRKDGSMWVVDGQARMLAAAQAGEGALFAKFHIGLSKQKEAELFRDLNKHRRAVKSLEDFKAALTQGDREAHEIHEVVIEVGGNIAEAQADREQHGAIIAVASLISEFRKGGGVEDGGPDHLRRTLTIIRDGFGDLTSAHAQEPTIKGVGQFVRAFGNAGVNPDYSRKHLIDRLKVVGFLGVIQQATMLRGVHGGAMWANVARALVPIYNVGVKDHLPPLETRARNMKGKTRVFGDGEG